ncbi:hypothetical protein [Tenacibaculum sp. 190524A05c]|uniref:Leucine rich repeat (LRR) protein n=1 Tax=Tenacibaculum platacis TaxID=3137852 RepID=A0ABM9NSI2_9FLAO
MNTKTLLFLLLLPFALLGQQTYVPDDAFEQFLINEGYDDVLDDYVLTDNIKDVSFLPMNNLGIQDLTGLEDFTNLNTVRVLGNPIQSIDLTANTELQYITLGHQSLTSLNIDGLMKLIRITLQDSSLTTLDVSNNTSIKYWV